MHEIRTSWAKETPPYGAFDDYIIIESIEMGERLLMRPEEFRFLALQLFKNYTNGRSKYIQLLKEWTEGIGFEDLDEKPSILLDNRDTIEALQLIEGVDQMVFAKLTKEDSKLILDFFVRNEQRPLKLWKDF